MANSAADELDAQISLHTSNSGGDDNGGSDRAEDVTAFQGRLLRLRMTALLCYGAGPIEGEDASAMIRLMVLINHGRVFFSDDLMRNQLEDLHTRVQNVMAAHAIHLLVAVIQNSSLLTAAVSSVLHFAPPHLTWACGDLPRSNGMDGVCQPGSFQATSSDNRIYSVNIITGAVLYDGWPPGRLPNEVVSHALYQRTFGRSNFEVSLDTSGVLRTIRPISGRYYEFFVSAGGKQLTITEVDGVKHGVSRLELLDTGADLSCGAWGQELPTRLRELHSHWLCREQNALVLRPRDFRCRDSHFLVTCKVDKRTAATGRTTYDCRQVPPHLRKEHWTWLLSGALSEHLNRRLVLFRKSCVKDKVLSKFEDPNFIHTYEYVAMDSLRSCAEPDASPAQGAIIRPSDMLLFELPRYGLEFELRDGQLLSNDYSGFRLCNRQQLVGTKDKWGVASASCCSVGQGGLLYTLPGFQQYLLLERHDSAGSAIAPGRQRAHVMLLVPTGEVLPSPEEGGVVRIKVPGSSGAALKIHRYEVHSRFGHLRTACTSARLQLAALYAATSTLLPEPLSRTTGAQTAMQLLRQCWSTQPLAPRDAAMLASVARLGGHLEPGLRLLAHELAVSAAQLAPLHILTSWGGGTAAEAQAAAREAAAAMPRPEPDAATAYIQAARCSSPNGWLPNPRGLLTHGEEARVLHSLKSSRAPEVPCWVRYRTITPIEVHEPLPTSADVVKQVEECLAGLVVVNTGTEAASPYPLRPLHDAAGGQAAATPLEADMHRELDQSWAAYQATPAPKQLTVSHEALGCIHDMQVGVQQQRAAMEDYLLAHLTAAPASVGLHGTSLRLLQQSGQVPSAGLLDLMRAAWRPELLGLFNPYHSEEARSRLHHGVLVWLQLCVLEDRLARVAELAAAGPDNATALVQELLVRRTWDAAAHPQWLVFEAEGQLQIRPAQHAVASLLLERPGAIAQLNMGEGKTRVILPMLALHWADGKELVRLHFLSPLLDEAYAHLHEHLTASVLGRKLFTLPFHRDVQLSRTSARAVQAILQYCQREGGLLIVAPEHRLSMELKWHELRARGEGQGDQEAAACAAALDAVAQLPYRDLLDESDELLHHRYQLVYACGGATALPDVQERTAAAQALLRTLTRLAAEAPSGKVDSLSPNTAVFEPSAGQTPGTFCGVRLLPGEALEAALPQLHRRLAEALVADPPYELRWLRQAGQQGLTNAILDCVTDAQQPALEALGPAARQLSGDQLAHVLALRGLLACGTLAHCLQRRHRVDYGMSRHPGARKRLAVPFRAADTPSERSEFAQPDVALLLTCLAYYDDGLSLEEFLAALHKLLSLGLNAQRDIFQEWLRLAGDGIPADVLVAFNAVEKIDPSNATQLAALHGHFKRNMAVVDFWLNNCVFPAETQQYPQRLAASAWHLADNARGALAGFSGTNDNHRLLPLQVHQADPPDTSLRATNGKMLAVILDNPHFTVLGSQPQLPWPGMTAPQLGAGRPASGAGRAEPASGPKPTWCALLDHALAEGLDALLDCGALLAGVSNRAAAEYILLHMDPARYKGVTYFDTDPRVRAWMVADARGARLPRHASPIHERDTIVIYDDARCRGSDLQLRRDAVGLLTLGPGICKDKVMPAAGRLRQLGRGQTLRFVAAPEVASKIRSISDLPQQEQLTSKHVLRWVMDNTVQATLRGIVEWAGQGLHFAATKGAPSRARQDELLELEAFYGGSRAAQPVSEVVAAKVRHQWERCSADPRVALTHSMEALMGDIAGRAALYGRGHQVVAGLGADEECERELELEEEQEQEVERQVPRVEPAAEQPWQYATALRPGAAVGQLDLAAGVMPLAQLARMLQPGAVHELAWSPLVYCTANFAFCASSLRQDWQRRQRGGQGPAPPALNEYLRPVDALLFFPASGQVLLLSEREADELQRRMWALPAVSAQQPVSSMPSAVLLSLPYARLTVSTGAPPRLALSVDGAAAARAGPLALGAAELVSMQLLNGECSYRMEGATPAAWGRIQAQLRALAGRRREAVEALVGMRGKQALLTRSDLERACEA